MNIILIKKLNFLKILLVAAMFLLTFQSVNAQDLDRIGRGQMKDMLNTIKSQIKKNYYDENFHGIDIEARFDKAEKRLDEVKSIAQAYAVIAQVLIDFDDSHLFFSPPETNLRVEYGLRMSMVGDKTFITGVKPKSDAEEKGVKVGDQILMFENFQPNRNDLWKMRYFYYRLSPRSSLHLKVLHPNSSEPEDITFNAKIIRSKSTINLWDTQDINDLIRESDDAQTRPKHFFQQVGNTTVWKMETFSFDPNQVNQIMQNTVKKGNNLILDLRGNGGGYVKTLEELAGYFVEKDTKIADRKGRDAKKKENEPSIAKSKGSDVFPGKLIVLIDNDSGSASEIFARFIQLEKRGIVLGDTSAGAVMQSIQYEGKYGAGINKLVFFYTSITNADVIMSDGKSLEHAGVTPNEKILVAGEDLASRRDPVLARALELLGNSVSAEQAGKFFKDHTWDN